MINLLFIRFESRKSVGEEMNVVLEDADFTQKQERILNSSKPNFEGTNSFAPAKAKMAQTLCLNHFLL